jgi:hypothetical protein
VPWFNIAGLPESTVDDAPLATANLAWEAAACWHAEPGYAARCLTEMRQRLGT